MAEVLPFGRPARGDPDAEGSLHGSAICLGCSHRWVAIGPLGARLDPSNELGLECPKCRAFKGLFVRFVLYDDVPNWTCAQCERHAFAVILAKGDVPTLSCLNCGHLSNAVDLFNKG